MTVQETKKQYQLTQWTQISDEARSITRQEFRWLMEGLSIEQPKALKIQPSGKVV